MENYDINGITYAEFDMHALWEETTQIQVCNATCHGILDPCESEALVELFALNCSESTSGLYVDLGLGFCRDNDGVKPNGYYKRLASASVCAQYCEIGPTCIGYAFSEDRQCYLYYSDFVARAGQDYSDTYEHWHLIPTGWFQFVPQGSAGSFHLASGDGNPSRRCFGRVVATQNTTNTTGPEPEPEPQPEPNTGWLNSGVSFGNLLPSSSGTPTLVGGEANSVNATVCWTGQQLFPVTTTNLAIGGTVEATPPGDVSWRALIDDNLDRNWHSSDGLTENVTQYIKITLPGSATGLHCISGLKVYWRNVYTASSYMVNTSTDGVSYSHDILQGAAMNMPADVGRIDEFEFPLHDAKHVQLALLAKQQQTTLDYDILEVEVYGLAGKCNDTFGHEPQVNVTSQLNMIQQLANQNPEASGFASVEAGSVFAEEAYEWQEACTPMPGQPSIDTNGGKHRIHWVSRRHIFYLFSFEHVSFAS